VGACGGVGPLEDWLVEVNKTQDAVDCPGIAHDEPKIAHFARIQAEDNTVTEVLRVSRETKGFVEAVGVSVVAEIVKRIIQFYPVCP